VNAITEEGHPRGSPTGDCSDGSPASLSLAGSSKAHERFGDIRIFRAPGVQ
jgi:hypothetical protein